MENGISSEIFYQHLPEHSYKYAGGTLDLFKEFPMNTYRVNDFSDEYTQNGYYLPLCHLRLRRQKTFKSILVLVKKYSMVIVTSILKDMQVQVII